MAMTDRDSKAPAFRQQPLQRAPSSACSIACSNHLALTRTAAR